MFPKRKNPAGQAFRQCAGPVRDSGNLSGYYFRRQKAKGGHKYATVCTAHKIAGIFFAVILHQTESDENLCAADEKLLLEKKIARTQKDLEVLNEKLGKSA